jgi:DNA-binding response OmpR family regulator
MGDVSGASRTKRILVVDDDEDVTMSMRDILMRAGYEAEGVTDGNKVFDIISKKVFDLIFLDLNLPEISGLEIFRRLREMGWLGKVCLMTGWPKGVAAHQGDYMALVEQGAIDKMLRKPFNKDEVLRAAKEIFGNGTAC